MEKVCSGAKKINGENCGSLWPNGVILYMFDDSVEEDPKMKEFINKAVQEWNDKNSPHCTFQYEEGIKSVKFVKDNDDTPYAHVGYFGLDDEQ